MSDINNIRTILDQLERYINGDNDIEFSIEGSSIKDMSAEEVVLLTDVYRQLYLKENQD